MLLDLIGSKSGNCAQRFFFAIYIYIYRYEFFYFNSSCLAQRANGSRKDSCGLSELFTLAQKSGDFVQRPA